MIRVACALALISLALLFVMLADTRASTAIPFAFVGHAMLGLAIAIYAFDAWRRRGGGESRE